MTETREAPVVMSLADGKVLIGGGFSGSAVLKTAELFNPSTMSFEAIPAKLTGERYFSSVALLQNGKVLIAGGTNNSAAQRTAELFNPATDTFESIAGELKTARFGATAATLPDGKVIIYGGSTGASELKTAELFNPATNTFEAVSSQLTESRLSSVAEPLPDGKILIAGGGPTLWSAEAFNPGTLTFEKLPAEMVTERVQPTGDVMPDGRILVTGGIATSKVLTTTEIYNPETEVFEALSAKLLQHRVHPWSAVLPNGDVLVGGGDSYEGYVRSAEYATSLAAQAQLSGGHFGEQTVGGASSTQTLVINSVGAENLFISGASLSGAQAGAFAIEADNCAEVELELRQICTIEVTFTPTAAGAYSASLTLNDTQVTPSTVSLLGTGVLPIQGEKGENGSSGSETTGSSGSGTGGSSGSSANATGSNGANGSGGDGGNGLNGTGLNAPGAAGALHKVMVATCKMVTTRVKHRRRSQLRCVPKLSPPPAGFAKRSSALKATLSRHGHVSASGVWHTGGGRPEFVSSSSKLLKKGLYVLTSSRRVGKHTRTTHQTVSVT